MRENSPPFGRLSLSLVTLAAAVALDYVSGSLVSPFLFYFTAILVISVLAGASIGTAFAFLAVLAWQFMGPEESASMIVVLWNGVSRFVMLGVAVALTALVKDHGGGQSEIADQGY